MTDRRAYDDEASDYRTVRKSYPVIVRRLNGHTRWAVGIVTTTVVVLAGWGVKVDRERIASDAAEALRQSAANSAAIAILQHQAAQDEVFKAEVKAFMLRSDQQSQQVLLQLAALRAELRNP